MAQHERPRLRQYRSCKGPEMGQGAAVPRSSSGADTTDRRRALDSGKMKFGIMLPRAFGPRRAPDIASRAEGLGYDSFWVTDFALGPPPDPMALLAAASQKTERILLGTAVMVLPYRHPVALAKTAATVDALSNGRLILGLGVGSNKREFDAMGLEIRRRGAMVDEKLALLRRLLSEQDVTHNGRFHRVEGVDVGPEPVQRPHPPIWLGPLWKDGLVEATVRRTGRLGDGFIPSSIPVSRYAAERQKVRAYAEKAGRDPDGITFAAVLWFCLDDDRERAWKVLEAESNYWRRDRLAARGQANVSGRAEDCVEAIQEYADAGVTHLVLNAGVPLERTVEQYEQFAREVLPLARGVSASL